MAAAQSALAGIPTDGEDDGPAPSLQNTLKAVNAARQVTSHVRSDLRHFFICWVAHATCRMRMHMQSSSAVKEPESCFSKVKT